MSSGRRIGVAVIGCGWMGRVHAQAYVRVRHHFPGCVAVAQQNSYGFEIHGSSSRRSPRGGTPGPCLPMRSPPPCCWTP
ncbi:MAG: hypothetical protein JWO98_1125 [Frankiales bacterium]|nr:hypothetical protein [Frankiales bacterium]